MTPLLLCLWTYQEAYIEILLSCDKFVTFKSMPNSRIMCPCPNPFCGNFLFPFPISTLILSLWWWFDLNWGLDWGRARCLGGWWAPTALKHCLRCEHTPCLRVHVIKVKKSQHEQYKKDAASATIERSVLTCSHAYPATQAPSFLLASYLFLFEGLTNSKLNTLLPN